MVTKSPLVTKRGSAVPELRRIAVNGTVLNVALAGEGPAVLLLHGFPHTWQL